MHSFNLPNTLGLAAAARDGLLVQSVEQLGQAKTQAAGLPITVLGEGSNVILAPTVERFVCLTSGEVAVERREAHELDRTAEGKERSLAGWTQFWVNPETGTPETPGAFFSFTRG